MRRPDAAGDGAAGQPPRRRWRGARSGVGMHLVVFVLAATLPPDSRAEAAPPVALGRAADALETPVRAHWTALPLAEWVKTATRLAGCPVVLDRRVDPDTNVTLACSGEPLGLVLEQVAAIADATVERLEGSLRIVPLGEAGRAVTGETQRRGEVADLNAAVRRRVEKREAWHWPAGGRPRELVETLAHGAGFRLAGIEAVPHDHLPAGDLAPLSLAERLDLLLAHYDLRVQWLPQGPRVVPLGPADRTRPTAPLVSRTSQPRRPRPAGREVFSLRLEAPLDQALAAIALRLGVALEIDTASLAARGVLPGVIARAEVTDASREELLDAIVGPLGLRWTITAGRLRVFAP